MHTIDESRTFSQACAFHRLLRVIERYQDLSSVESPASLYVADSRHTSCHVPGICDSW